ncbi:MAG: class I SAM-dependent methyltransferase [Promethearchaeota archaeon]
MFSNSISGFRSITYRSGYVYNWLTKRLYDQKKKFLSIAHLIGRNKKVLDLPCGTGYLCQFLHPSIEYIGYDLNHRFLKKLRVDQKRGKVKLKKLTTAQQNIFDYDKYPEKVDVIVFCDILHHIFPKHTELVEKAKKHAEKIIICEPVAVKPQDINARDKFFKLIIFFARFLPEPLLKIIDFFFFDNDGINSYDDRSEWKHDESSLKEMYRGLGIQDNRIYNITDDYIGVWERNGHV